jgi:crotonobetaine/carnitine-CoA ligase
MDRLTDPLREAADRRGDEIFLLTAERNWSYAELWTESGRIAGGLAGLGVQPGNHVALMLDNTADFLVSWYALSRLGAVEVPINTAHHGDHLRHVLEHSGSVALICEPHYLGRVAELGPTESPLRCVVHRGDEADLGGVANEALGQLDGDVPNVAASARDRAAVMYTSGTTGRSKGVVLSHRYFLQMAAANVANMRLTPDDTYYTCLPLFHGMAQLSGMTAPLIAGARVALVPRFSVSQFWDDCRRFDVTGFGAIAAMSAMLFQAPPSAGDRDHRVRFAFSIAVPATIQRDFEERFGVRVIDGYGITEGGQISYSPYDAPKVGSCGVPVPLYEVELHDEHGSPVAVGEVGEIVVRPRRPGVCMDGYWNDPVATLAAFRDLWLHTGDLGRFDDQGYLYFVDRAKDAIRRRGENISSVEVELAVSRHPAVSEVAAYPVPSELGEDEVMLAVVVHTGHQLAADELVAHCRRELPRFAIPRYIRFVDALPRTPTQKVEKYRLRAAGVTADTYETASGR